jgi:hypothetical protein
MRNALVSAATVALTLAIATTATFAANPQFCASYASKALKAEAVNLDDGCGLYGARWSFDFAGHYSWCLGVTKGQANSETWARKASIIDCEGDY